MRPVASPHRPWRLATAVRTMAFHMAITPEEFARASYPCDAIVDRRDSRPNRLSGLPTHTDTTKKFLAFPTPVLL